MFISLRARKWLMLTVWVGAIWLFMFVVGPLIQRNSTVRELAVRIEESGIESTALWWSEVEVVGDAEMNCRNTLEYPPVTILGECMGEQQ